MCVISVFHSLFCINDTLDIHTSFILTGICKIFDDHEKLITSRKKNAPQSDLCLGGGVISSHSNQLSHLLLMESQLDTHDPNNAKG